MTARYLLDTNVLSEPLRSSPNAGVIRRLHRYGDQVVTATPVWHELVFGCFRLPESKRKTALQNYLGTVLSPTLQVLPYDKIAAEWHGHERARLEKVGVQTSFVDGQIAAVARMHDLVLVTANVPHFTPFKGLVVENWFS